MPTTSICPFSDPSLCSIFGLVYSEQYGTYVPQETWSAIDPITIIQNGIAWLMEQNLFFNMTKMQIEFTNQIINPILSFVENKLFPFIVGIIVVVIAVFLIIEALR